MWFGTAFLGVWECYCFMKCTEIVYTWTNTVIACIWLLRNKTKQNKNHRDLNHGVNIFHSKGNSASETRAYIAIILSNLLCWILYIQYMYVWNVLGVCECIYVLMTHKGMDIGEQTGKRLMRTDVSLMRKTSNGLSQLWGAKQTDTLHLLSI